MLNPIRYLHKPKRLHNPFRSPVKRVTLQHPKLHFVCKNSPGKDAGITQYCMELFINTFHVAGYLRKLLSSHATQSCRLVIGHVTQQSQHFTLCLSGFKSVPDKSHCEYKRCKYPRARTWVQCGHCEGWWHCKCAGMTLKCSKKENYTCKTCQL